jgi:hypothetical protein
MLDEVRLAKTLTRRWGSPLCALYSWIMTQLTDFGEASVSDQMGHFKKHLKIDNLSKKVSDYFPRTGKKEMILEDISNGFVRRGYRQEGE